MRKTFIIGVVALTAGIAIGHFGFGTKSGTDMESADSSEREILYWVAPMDPNFRRDTPGKSPMGMDLIPVYEGEESGDNDENALQISASVVNNIGVRTAPATVSDLYREINSVGYVTMDETRTSHVHVRSAGWIEKLNKKAVGEPVKKGEVVFELYSPELVAAQSEYLQALRLKNPPLISASADRLRALGMTANDIVTIEKNGKTMERIEVLAPQDGVIMKLSVGEGMYITPGRTVFSLADLSRIWVKVEVFEAQSSWVAVGQDVALTLPYAPGEIRSGTVNYIYPDVDPKSRTIQVRLAFDNTDGKLKPNMFGEVSINASAIENALSIPREALIRTGKTDRVILALGDGKFRPAEVVAGVEVGDRVVITDGLAEGEHVVTSGQFLLDSEASLNGAFLRMLDADSEEGMGMDMAGDIGDEAVHHGMGTVVSINDNGTVTMTHDPIESLGWPEMTMDFAVAPSVDLSVFEAGDRMHFMIKKSDAGLFIITTAMKM